MNIPQAMTWRREQPNGAAWLDSLPDLAAEVASEWSLNLGAPLDGSNMGLVLAAERADGSPAVLKLNFPPEDESAQEADALAFWEGQGAIRLLDQDTERGALLLEWCEPGTRLVEVRQHDERDAIAAQVLRRLWRPPPATHPFRSVRIEAARWAEQIRDDWETLGRPFDRSLVHAAAAACHELGPHEAEAVVLHGDFHGANVLRAQREPWLAIDPAPLVGAREYDAASVLRDPPLEQARARAERLADELELDREHVRRWGLVVALRWGISARKLEREMIELTRALS